MRPKVTYPGDSAAKKISRLAFWLKVRELLGVARFKRGKYLVLASREAGDVSVLLGLGIPIESITAIPKEAALARLKFDGLCVVEEDILMYVRMCRPEYDCICLDFCTWTTPAAVQRVVAAAAALCRGGLLGCNFLVGREMMQVRKKMRAIRRVVDAHVASMPSIDQKETAELASYFSRAGFIQQELAKHLSARPVATFFYRARRVRRGEQGHPWCTQLLRYTTKVQQGVVVPEMHDPTEEEFRDYVLQLLRQGHPVNLLLNIPKSSLAAWKAHATRGTYRKHHNEKKERNGARSKYPRQ